MNHKRTFFKIGLIISLSFLSMPTIFAACKKAENWSAPVISSTSYGKSKQVVGNYKYLATTYCQNVSCYMTGNRKPDGYLSNLGLGLYIGNFTAKIPENMTPSQKIQLFNTKTLPGSRQLQKICAQNMKELCHYLKKSNISRTNASQAILQACFPHL